jgi:GNAT superfamily N-acetyltransferase
LIYELWTYFSENNFKKVKKINIETKKIINTLPSKIVIPLSNPIKSQYGCHHYADIGLACPTEAHTNMYDIVPFQYVNINKQKIISQYLQTEWGHKKNYTIDTILEEWPLIDALYVMTYNKTNKSDINTTIGCIAIDRKHFFPFISHLYVKKELRQKGYGAVLIDFALKTVKILGFTKCKLWCDVNQIDYYKKMGWIIEDQKNGLYIMSIQL